MMHRAVCSQTDTIIKSMVKTVSIYELTLFTPHNIIINRHEATYRSGKYMKLKIKGDSND